MHAAIHAGRLPSQATLGPYKGKDGPGRPGYLSLPMMPVNLLESSLQEHCTPNDELMKTRDSIAEPITDRATFTLALPATPSPLTRTTDL